MQVPKIIQKPFICKRKLNCILPRRSTVCINCIICCRLGAEYLQVLRTFSLFMCQHSALPSQSQWEEDYPGICLASCWYWCWGQTPPPFLEEGRVCIRHLDITGVVKSIWIKARHQCTFMCCHFSQVNKKWFVWMKIECAKWPCRTLTSLICDFSLCIKNSVYFSL